MYFWFWGMTVSEVFGDFQDGYPNPTHAI